jgi:circadian clock protein KaiC
MLSPGLALQPLVAKGRLAIRSYLPEAMGVEEHLYHSLEDLEQYQPASVVVDAISACRRMGSEQAAFEYLMRILNACKERGITCLCLNQSSGRESIEDISGIGISSLIDTVILLSHRQAGDTMVRQLVVMKARGSRHSEQFHHFRITDRGFALAKS